MADSAYKYDEGESIKGIPPLNEVKWTYKDYKDWDLEPGIRVELIHGIVYAMAAPNTLHQRISMILSGELYYFFKGKTCQSFTAPYDVRLFYQEDESDDTVVQPDIIIVCDPNKLGKEGCRDAPDAVIEILSSSNTAMEMDRKKNLYLKAGVPELWIVNPELQQVEINIIENGRYIPYVFRLGDVLRSFKFTDFELAVDVLFAEMNAL